jgi:transcriptional regulator with XRE-family HTH domain
VAGEQRPVAPRPAALGDLIRGRRAELALSMRGVARAAGVSPSYLSAIETGRNPATGRAPTPSLRVLAALGEVLQLDLTSVLAAVGIGDQADEADRRHTLLYVLAPRPVDVIDHIARLHGTTTERWVYIPDPREAAPPGQDERVALCCRWPLGAEPYPDRTLDPRRVVEALTRDLRSGGARIPAARVGIAIADCSAVMRWVTNPETEVAFEAHWQKDAERTFRETLGRPPTDNVCVYHHDDIEALGHQVDPLGTALALIRAHDTVAAVEADGRLRTGAPAARAILTALRPAGVSRGSWSDLCAAASAGLTGHDPAQPARMAAPAAARRHERAAAPRS